MSKPIVQMSVHLTEHVQEAPVRVILISLELDVKLVSISAILKSSFICILDSDWDCDCDCDCELDDTRVNMGDTYSGKATTGTWNYWHAQYFTMSPLSVNVTQTSTGDCDLYVRSGQNPTRFIYQFAELSVSQEFGVVIPSAGNDTWYIGIYGWSTCSYDIVVNIVGQYESFAIPLFFFNNSNQVLSN
jgi:hypothetical protein